MSNPKNHPNKGGEDTKSYIDATFERLIDLLDGSLLTLSLDQYRELEKFLPDNRDSGLSTDELAKHVRGLISKNCNSGDFGNTMTDVYIEVMQSSTEQMTKTQLEDISKLLPDSGNDAIITNVDYENAKDAISDAIDRTAKFNNDPSSKACMVTDMVSELMVKLNTGFTIEQLTRICVHFDGHHTVKPMIVDGRDEGTLVDSATTERYRIVMERPKSLNDLSSDVRKLAEKLDTLNYKVDYKAWEAILKHVPQYNEIKWRLKKIEKAVGLTKLRKQIKQMVS